DDEREEYGNTNHPDDNANSFFKPYLDAQEENSIYTFMKGRDEHRPETHDCCANSEDSIEEVVTETMIESTLRKHMEEVRADYGSNTITSRFNKNAKFKLGGEFLKILCDNAFNGTNGDDVVDHTTKVLAILELIEIPNVDPNQHRMHVFPFSLTGVARK
nr:hypothetical protein [Tanacetum cinerariifolium]